MDIITYLIIAGFLLPVFCILTARLVMPAPESINRSGAPEFGDYAFALLISLVASLIWIGIIPIASLFYIIKASYTSKHKEKK